MQLMFEITCKINRQVFSTQVESDNIKNVLSHAFTYGADIFRAVNGDCVLHGDNNVFNGCDDMFTAVFSADSNGYNTTLEGETLQTCYINVQVIALREVAGMHYLHGIKCEYINKIDTKFVGINYGDYMPIV